MTEVVDEVFYVDDSPDDRLIANHYHRAGNYSFALKLFSTGPEVLLDIEQRLAGRQGLPRLVVVDHYMPVMDGPEVLRLIRADPRLAEIILAVCSGGDDPADVQAAKNAGADVLLQKPLDLDRCRALLDGGLPREE